MIDFQRNRKAMIIGVSGQDGRLLSTFLQSKGYKVIGISRNKLEAKSLSESIIHIQEDIKNVEALLALIRTYSPDEIYYLAAYHHSSEHKHNKEMFGDFYSVNVRPLQTIFEYLVYNNHIKLFYASSCHVFGKAKTNLQDEDTPKKPNSFYGITKLCASLLCDTYRENYGVFATVGILYNHESIYRDQSFVTTKIANIAAKATFGETQKITVRNLNAIVDWGAAEDYVEAMWLLLQCEKSASFIIASGVERTVREFAEIAFNYVGKNYADYIIQSNDNSNRQVYRYVGNPSKILNLTNWKQKISFNTLVENMVDHQISTYV